MLDRTTAYLVDADGVVRQIFPMTIHHRPSWRALLGELDALLAGEYPDPPQRPEERSEG